MQSEYVSEACFYLSELDVSPEEIAKQLNLTPEQAETAIKQYRSRIGSGQLKFEDDTKKFWSVILKENSGDRKMTLVDDKGRYYHGWRTEVEKLTTEELVQLLALNKKYSDRHPLSEFSKTQPVVGYDPLVPLRDIRNSVSMIDEILQKRSVEEEPDKHRRENEKHSMKKKSKSTRTQ